MRKINVPENHTGSLRIPAADTMTADQIDVLIRRIADKVWEEHRVTLTAISL